MIEFALRGAINECIWAQASRWHCGEGLHQGPDATVLQRHLKRLRRGGAHGDAAILQMIAAGALWTASRRFGAESGRTDGGTERAEGPQPQAGDEATGGGGALPPKILADLDAPEADVDFDLEAALDDAPFCTEEAEPWFQDSEAPPAHFNMREQHWASPLCPRCHQAEEATLHQLWTCPANETIIGVHMDLAIRVEAEWREAPCYWLRGMPPRRWTAAHCTLPTQGEAQ